MRGVILYGWSLTYESIVFIKLYKTYKALKKRGIVLWYKMKVKSHILYVLPCLTSENTVQSNQVNLYDQHYIILKKC